MSVASDRLGPIDVIESSDPDVVNRSLESIVSDLDADQMIEMCRSLDRYRRGEDNLYRRVRSLFFLSAIHRYHLPPLLEHNSGGDAGKDHVASAAAGLIPADGHEHLMARRFLEAIDRFVGYADRHGYRDAICSALSAAYHDLALQTLADQVKRSVRTVAGNRWMFRMGHPLDHPLRIQSELMGNRNGPRPILHEQTAVRMDLSHSAWSDIFFLGMDYPEGARVLNISVNLGVRGRDQSPAPPIETFFRLIDEPVIRLVSIDLAESVEISSIGEMFDFGCDHLGLLKAAVIAAGVTPPGLEGSHASMAELLARLIPASTHDKGSRPRGFELVSQINDIPKGSRLAVSTNLLGSLISILMRATGQIEAIDGVLSESRSTNRGGPRHSWRMDRRQRWRLAGQRRGLAGHQIDPWCRCRTRRSRIWHQPRSIDADPRGARSRQSRRFGSSKVGRLVGAGPRWHGAERWSHFGDGDRTLSASWRDAMAITRRGDVDLRTGDRSALRR